MDKKQITLDLDDGAFNELERAALKVGLTPEEWAERYLETGLHFHHTLGVQIPDELKGVGFKTEEF